MCGKINVERGAEGELARENVETTKTGGNTGAIRCEGAVSMSKLVWCWNNPILCQTNLQVHVRKLAETDPKSALRLPKWAMITMVKVKL